MARPAPAQRPAPHPASPRKNGERGRQPSLFLVSKAKQSRGRRTAGAGFGAASRSPWIASSQGLLAMTVGAHWSNSTVVGRRLRRVATGRADRGKPPSLLRTKPDAWRDWFPPSPGPNGLEFSAKGAVLEGGEQSVELIQTQLTRSTNVASL